MGKSKKVKLLDKQKNITPCTNCNPKKYLTFNFSYITHENPKNPRDEDVIKFFERMRWMSKDTFLNNIYTYRNDKARWIENIDISQIKKEVPREFRKDFPTETNEKYSVMRVYPAGRPNGSANPRIIGMIKYNIFYVFFLDWEGKLYDHGR